MDCEEEIAELRYWERAAELSAIEIRRLREVVRDLKAELDELEHRGGKNEHSKENKSEAA